MQPLFIVDNRKNVSMKFSNGFSVLIEGFSREREGLDQITELMLPIVKKDLTIAIFTENGKDVTNLFTKTPFNLSIDKLPLILIEVLCSTEKELSTF